MLPVGIATVGHDRRLRNAVGLSRAEKVGNERFFRRDAKRLTRARHKVARIADRRREFTYQRSTRIIRENQVVYAEGWNVKGVLAHPTLAKSIADVGWGELLRQLEYKARWYGRTFVPIDRLYPSSKRCHAFRHTMHHRPLEVR